MKSELIKQNFNFYDKFSRCEYQQECSILVNWTTFTDTCPGTPKYLEAVYDCVKGDKKIFMQMLCCNCVIVVIVCLNAIVVVLHNFKLFFLVLTSFKFLFCVRWCLFGSFCVVVESLEIKILNINLLYYYSGVILII